MGCAYLEKRMSAELLRKRLQMEATYGYARVGGEHFLRFVIGRVLKKSLHVGIVATGLSKRGRCNALDVRLHTVEHGFAHLPQALDGFRILQLSDTHIDTLPELGERIVRVLQGVDYDMCVHTGDFRDRSLENWRKAIDYSRVFMEVLKPPVYCVLGNHDLLELVEPLEAMGARFLLNESVEIRTGEARWVLSGIDDPYHYTGYNVAQASAGHAENTFKILLAHEASVYQAAIDHDYSLMLCGHTHGGQVSFSKNGCLPGVSRGLANMFRGAWSSGTMRGYTSVGTGCSAVAARFNSRPEIVLHVLKKTSDLSSSQNSEVRSQNNE